MPVVKTWLVSVNLEGLMRIALRLIIVVALVWGLHCCGAGAQEWEAVRTDPQAGPLVAIAIHPMHPERIVVAGQRALYESPDNGQSWQERFRLPAQATAAGVAVSASEQPSILLATDQGLYGSFAGGQRWSRIFRGSSEGQGRCTSVAFHPAQRDVALLGTQGGLFISQDGGRHWKAVAIPPDAHHIISFAFHPSEGERLYLLTDRGVFAGTLSGGEWQLRRGTFNAEEPEVEESGEPEAGEDHDSLHHLSAIAVDPQDASTLYLATSQGLERSPDDGLTWQPVSNSGLASTRMSHLLLQRHSPLMVYAATDRGVARYEPAHEQWTMITSGFAAGVVNGLADSSHAIWAATEHGLYRLPVSPADFGDHEPPSAHELLSNFVNEPTITQVQEVAIRYAEVHPKKIQHWRRQAALQALLPVVDLGWDRKRSLDTNVDKGTFPKFQLLETEDRNAGFDFSVKWELGNLIWNDDQTSIDVRSKLMVQLRDDIVNEVTRTYFERRRLQMALLTEPPDDQRVLADKELRLQELTAMLDGLTGGSFSKSLRISEQP